MSAIDRARATVERLGFDLASIQEGRVDDGALTAGLTGGDAESLGAALGILGTTALAMQLTRIEPHLGAREARKLARRALHQLRERGVETAPSAHPAPRVAPTSLSGFVSAFDGRGDRVVWLVRERSAGGMLVVAGIINEPGGLTDVRLLETTPKQLRAFRRDIAARGTRLVAAPWAIVDALLVEAHERRNAPDDRQHDYLRLRKRMTDAPPLAPTEPRSPHVPPGEPVDAAALVHTSAELLAHTELRWWPGHDRLEPFLAELTAAQDSPIVLSEAQQAERFRQVIARAVALLFPADTTARRLEGTAYVLAETERATAAVHVLAVVDAVRARPDTADIPLLAALVQQSLSAHLALAREGTSETRQDSVIVTPDELRARTPTHPPHTRS